MNAISGKAAFREVARPRPGAAARVTVWHPGAWIAWATCAGLVAFVTTDPVYLLLLVAVSWFVYTAHRLPGPTAASFRMFLLAGVLTLIVRTSLVFFGTVDPAAVSFAALEGLRLATILVIFGTFNAVTDPFGIVRLAPRRFHEPALAAALALSIAPRTVASVHRVREAQRLRGIHVSPLRSLPALAVPVLENGMEEAVTLAESMDARGHGRGTRSRYRPQSWTGAAVATTAVGLFAAAVFLWAAFGGWAVLHPVTSPLTWPEADPLLLAAIAGLALPGVLTAGAGR
jgi:energy-coupling factor transport system permease protein